MVVLAHLFTYLTLSFGLLNRILITLSKARITRALFLQSGKIASRKLVKNACLHTSGKTFAIAVRILKAFESVWHKSSISKL